MVIIIALAAVLPLLALVFYKQIVRYAVHLFLADNNIALHMHCPVPPPIARGETPQPVDPEPRFFELPWNYER